MTALSDALSARFTDADEIKDVAYYGCAAGVSGFIYSTELAEFFDEHESDIEDVLDMFDVRLNQLVKDETAWTFQEMKESAVWYVVEEYCQSVALCNEG